MKISSNTTPTKLNPHAQEYFPNTNNDTNIFPFTYLPPHFYHPPPQQQQQTVINFIYGYCPQIYPSFPTKTIYLNYQNKIMLPAVTKPGLVKEMNPVELTSSLVREAKPVEMAVPMVRKSKPSFMKRAVSRECSGSGSSTGTGFGRWFWFKKDVVNHPVARATNYPYGESTSLMIRNIPVRFSRKELMERLEEHCRIENEKISETSNDDEPASEFDFLYLPIDFKWKGNLGYAFVNFTTWQGASRLFASWNKNGWEDCSYNTKKICQINCAKFQGKQMLMRHFDKSLFPCETDDYLPVEISPPMNGVNADQATLATVGRRIFKGVEVKSTLEIV